MKNFSKFIEFGHSRIQTKFVGTLSYKAPEILIRAPYDRKVDVYSFAILMFEVLTDTMAYPELEKSEIADYKFKQKVVEENHRPEFTVPIKKSFRQLIEKCWSKEPTERPNFEEIFNKLSNNDIQDDDENYLLDDVDMDEINLYLDDITEINDSTEELLNKIETLKKENKNYIRTIKTIKSDNDKLKIENEEYKN